MKTPSHILSQLLRGVHFNVDKIKSLGLWPPAEIAYADLLSHLSKTLEQEEWFSHKPNLDSEDPSIEEGIFIHRESESRYICHAIRHAATSPQQLAERTQNIFGSATEAAAYFLKWQHHLPGKLDAWTVV